MKLGTKIATAISLVFMLVLGTAAAALVHDELDFVEEEMDVHGRLLGHVLASVVHATIAERGEAAARSLVHEIDLREDRITIQWIQVKASGATATTLLSAELIERLRLGHIVGRINPHNDTTLSTFVPLGEFNGALQVIWIAESLQARNLHVQNLVLQILVGVGVGFILSWALAYVLGRRLVSRPVMELIAVARRVGAGDFTQRADEGRGDELGLLAREVNAMAANLAQSAEQARKLIAEQRDMEAHLNHADRLSTLGELASGVAHEIGTPLQSITIRAEIIDQNAGHLDGVKDCVQGIQREANRVAKIVKNLLRFARKQPTERVPTDLQEVVASAVALVQLAKTSNSINVAIADMPPNIACVAAVDPEQIEQVLTNLILNGMQSMDKGGTLRVGIERVDAGNLPALANPENEFVCLYVQDEGRGIPEDILPHIFDPFFTTKPINEGTGLGLSVSHGIVREHGGWIQVETSIGEGTRFRVYLPVLRADESEASPPLS